MDSVRSNEDEDGVPARSRGCSRGRERTDSDGGGKMNAGVLVSTWRVIRASELNTRGVGGRERALVDSEGREKEREGLKKIY